MKRRLLTVFWTIVISFLFTGVAYAANGEETTVKTVAAILAAALGIERALEMFWGIVESIGDIIMKKDQSDNPEAGSEKTDWTDKDKYKSFKTWFSALLGLVPYKDASSPSNNPSLSVSAIVGLGCCVLSPRL